MLTVEDETNKENKLNASSENIERSVNSSKTILPKDNGALSSDEENFHRKKRTVLDDSSDEENQLVIDENQPMTSPSLSLEPNREKFLVDNIESDMDSDAPMLSKNAKKFDSDSVPTDGKESSSDIESFIKKKKKKKLKKSRKKNMAKEDLLDKSKLTDDENDELLKDLETMLNEPNSEPDLKDVGNEKTGCSDSESGSSVGMPEDTYIVRKTEGTEDVKSKKEKIYKDFDPEDWQNEEVKEKEYKDSEKKKGEKKKKETLDPVALLVSERQKMMRESEISLPRHEPVPLQLSDCLARIPKLTTLRPTRVEEKKSAFVPKLSSKTDEFFLPKDLGNFMGRFKKHLSLSSKVNLDSAPKKCNLNSSKKSTPQSVFIKRNIQQELKDKILAMKIEARKAAEQERLVDEEFRTEDSEYTELQKMLDNDEEEEMSESDEDQKEEEEILVEEVENVDEKMDRRAEKILLGEEVSSSSGEDNKQVEVERKERNYHTDTDSDLLASADEVHVNELPATSASEDDALEPSRYSLRRLTRYVRKKRLTKRRKKEELVPKENSANKEPDSDEDSQSVEKIEKAKRKIESILEKRKEIKQKKDAIKAKKAKLEKEKLKMEEIRKKAEEDAILAEEQRKSSSSQIKKTASKPATVRKPWLSDSEDEELPEFETEGDGHNTPTAGQGAKPEIRSKRDWANDSMLELRAARILAGEDLSSSSEESGEPQRKYHSDTDSDLLASADEVHVNELPATSASEDDALQPSRYSLRRLTRYCRKKRIAREKRHVQRVAIGSESEKEEKARRKLQDILKRREEIKKKIYRKKTQKREDSCTSIQDLFGGSGGLSLTGISRPSDSQSLPSASRDSVHISSTIIPDSMDTLPISEKTFDVDTAVRNVVEDSQYSGKSSSNFLPPDEDAVFLDTQGMLRSGLDISGEGGIDALAGDGSLLDNSMDLLNLCSGRFGSSAADSGGFGGTAPDSGGFGGRVTVQDISFNLATSPSLVGSGLSQTPNHSRTPSYKNRTPLPNGDPEQTTLFKGGTDQTPLRKGLSQTPLTRFGNLAGLLSQESDEEEEHVSSKAKGKKRRALYSDLLDNEAEKSGSDHSDDENEEDHDEYDKSMMAKDSELPSDEEELAAQLKLAYHDQQALDEKAQIKRLKERFIQEEQGFFRTRKFHGEDSNMDLFSTNLGLDFEDDNVETSAETYKEAMEKRTERLKREQFVKEKRIKEASKMNRVDEDSQAFLDTLQDITDSNSRSAFSSSQQCGSFLKHTTGTLSRLSSVTSSSLNSDKTSNRAYVFQTVSPGQTKRKSSGKFASEPKRPKKFTSSGVPASPSADSSKLKSIFNVIK
ncbi:claspin-like isoform X2 [Bolinopsis microptera]|uniref:claspin-like isoform X2 n=1 Tax=Bolinopsis microptera TaxID=2820187 RepID=UPI00307972EF